MVTYPGNSLLVSKHREVSCTAFGVKAIPCFLDCPLVYSFNTSMYHCMSCFSSSSYDNAWFIVIDPKRPAIRPLRSLACIKYDFANGIVGRLNYGHST